MKVITHLGRAAMLLALLSLAGCAEWARTPLPAPVVAVAQIQPSPSPDPPLPTLAPTKPSPTAVPTAVPSPTPVASPTLVCVENTGRVDTGQLPSAILPSGKVPYAIYFPPCYDTRVRYPVAYLLHGIPFDEAQWLSLGWQVAADQAISSHRVPPFIAVFPRGDGGQAYNNSSGGDGSWEQVMVKELIPYIDTVYNTLASKHSRAIGGISRGAVWALEIAFRNPDLFEAVGGHSSAMAVNKASPEFDPLQIAQSDNVDQLFGLHILLDSGDTDWTLQETAQLHAILDERGITNTLLVGRGGHVAKYWASQMDNYVAFYGSSFTGLLADGTTPK